MGKWTNLAGGCAMLCATSQFPEFSQQYVQRLGGAVDELRRVAADFDASARAAGLTRETALASMTGGAFQDRRRADMTRSFARLERLEAHYTALRDADAPGRLIRILRFDDWQIARRTGADYAWAIPLTRDGVTFSLTGFLLGFFTTMGSGLLISRRRVDPEKQDASP